MQYILNEEEYQRYISLDNITKLKSELEHQKKVSNILKEFVLYLQKKDDAEDIVDEAFCYPDEDCDDCWLCDLDSHPKMKQLWKKYGLKKWDVALCLNPDRMEFSK